MAEHSPGPWTLHELGDCILDANGHHLICFGHDYDDYGGFLPPYLGRQKDQKEKEDAVADANKELVRLAPEMLDAIFALRDALKLLHDVSDYELGGASGTARRILMHTQRFEKLRAERHGLPYTEEFAHNLREDRKRRAAE